jgi:hypothetical protein
VDGGATVAVVAVEDITSDVVDGGTSVSVVVVDGIA